MAKSRMIFRHCVPKCDVFTNDERTSKYVQLYQFCRLYSYEVENFLKKDYCLKELEVENYGSKEL